MLFLKIDLGAIVTDYYNFCDNFETTVHIGYNKSDDNVNEYWKRVVLSVHACARGACPLCMHPCSLLTARFGRACGFCLLPVSMPIVSTLKETFYFHSHNVS